MSRKKYKIDFDSYEFVGLTVGCAYDSLTDDDRQKFTGPRNFMSFLRNKGGYYTRKSNGNTIIEWKRSLPKDVESFLSDLQGSSATLPPDLQERLSALLGTDGVPKSALQCRKVPKQGSSATLHNTTEQTRNKGSRLASPPLGGEVAASPQSCEEDAVSLPLTSTCKDSPRVEIKRSEKPLRTFAQIIADGKKQQEKIDNMKNVSVPAYNKPSVVKANPEDVF